MHRQTHADEHSTNGVFMWWCGMLKLPLKQTQESVIPCLSVLICFTEARSLAQPSKTGRRGTQGTTAKATKQNKAKTTPQYQTKFKHLIPVVKNGPTAAKYRRGHWLCRKTSFVPIFQPMAFMCSKLTIGETWLHGVWSWEHRCRPLLFPPRFRQCSALTNT